MFTRVESNVIRLVKVFVGTKKSCCLSLEKGTEKVKFKSQNIVTQNIILYVTERRKLIFLLHMTVIFDIPGHGLLHSMPKKYRQELTDALYDCVEEMAVGGRITAVEEMLEILAQFSQDQTM